MTTKNERLGGLTHVRLKELVKYNRSTGLFTWIIRPHRASKSGFAGSLKPSGYITIDIDGFRYRAHRLAWFYVKGEWPKHQIDHKDTVRSNNKWSNLRSAKNKENATNRTKNRNNTSGYKGVYWCKQKSKWVAKINLGKVQKHLGVFVTAYEAHLAYKKVSGSVHKEFSRT